MAKRKKQPYSIWWHAAVLAMVVIIGAVFVFQWQRRPAASSTVGQGMQPVRQPDVLVLAQSPLRESIIAAGDYLIRQQLPNGDLTYQVDVVTGNRNVLPVSVRQLAATSGLYTVCQVSRDQKYCDAADRALAYYWKDIVPVPAPYQGVCYFSTGGCLTGASGIAIDAVYKRWLATGNVMLGDENLLETARAIGRFITSFKLEDGTYGELLYPVAGGIVDPFYTSWYNPSESVYALAELYDMTGENVWLENVQVLNAFLESKPATADQWHSHALNILTKLGKANKDDIAYGKKISGAILAKESATLVPTASAFDLGTKVEALAALAQVMARSGEGHTQLADAAQRYIQFLQVRQMPDVQCGWKITDVEKARYAGGFITNCDESVIRADTGLHWIYGVTAFLEYQALAAS